MDWKLETVVVPVSDVDRAKAFYIARAGFGPDIDAARAELVDRGVDATEVFHYDEGGRVPGWWSERAWRHASLRVWLMCCARGSVRHPTAGRSTGTC